MKMAQVTQCDADECAYNWEGTCHALEITIGDETHPMCDTFCQSSQKGCGDEMMAGVGACKVSACMHNSRLECECSEIQVGHLGSEVDCLSCMID